MNIRNICDPRANQLLGALTEPEFELLAPHLELVALSSGEVLFEAYERPKYIHFPITATVSLMCCLEEGINVEVAMVSNEGILGASALIIGGNNYVFTEAVVRQPGYGYHICIKPLEKAFARSRGRRSGILEELISRYDQTLFIQLAQATACSRRHFLEQQFCTWLLSCFNRGHSNTLAITHEMIGLALGVRRESITELAIKLQGADIITYRRRYIELKNKGALEAKACECYKILGREFARLKSDFESFHSIAGLEAV